jgi:hypothetical protein
VECQGYSRSSVVRVQVRRKASTLLAGLGTLLLLSGLLAILLLPALAAVLAAAYLVQRNPDELTSGF